MTTMLDLDPASPPSWAVFRHIGTTLEHAPVLPARPRARPATGERRPTSWDRFDIVIAHGSPIVAEGLLTALSRQTGARASICDDEAALRDRVASDSPCLVFSDYATAVAGARRLSPSAACAWACVTTRDREADIRDALRAGVFGYLLADCPIADYVACVRGLGQAQRYLCQRTRRQLSEADERQVLTLRETEVLQLVVGGCSNQDIAERLHITLSTAKVHVGNILKKLGARSRTQAAVLAGASQLLGEGLDA